MFDRNGIRLYNDQRCMHLAVNIYEKTYNYLALFNKMLQKKDIDSYSFILITSKYDDLGTFVSKRKRRSDLLLEIDKSYNVYALICAETESEGGFYFYKRLSDDLYKESEKEMISSILSVEAESVDLWELVYRVSSSFIDLSFNEPRSQDIILNRYTSQD